MMKSRTRTPSVRRRHTARPSRRVVLRLEVLERRETPAALTPAQVRQAYGFTNVPYDGSGQTIAIVDAYDDPYIASDLHQFDVRYGLPGPPVFSKVSQTGSLTALPRANAGWAGEIALDVEWAHAIAPKANILLVEARSNSNTDLLAAVDFAAKHANVVSMSWGGGELRNETSLDSHFNVPGVTFVASSGDNGAGPSWPAVSPYVVAVGGTTLSVDSQGNLLSAERAWSGSGGGRSTVASLPGFQSALASLLGTHRGSPDVAYDANPSTGFSVYNTYARGWEQVGGTSAGAPQWAALVALADQGRNGQPLSSTETLTALYANPGAFNDITAGANRRSTATSGYDLVTGLGSPKAPAVVSALIGLRVPDGRSVAGILTAPPGSGGGTVRVPPQSVLAPMVVPSPDAATAALPVAASITPGAAVSPTPSELSIAGNLSATSQTPLQSATEGAWWQKPGTPAYRFSRLALFGDVASGAAGMDDDGDEPDEGDGGG